MTVNVQKGFFSNYSDVMDDIKATGFWPTTLPLSITAPLPTAPATALPAPALLKSTTPLWPKTTAASPIWVLPFRATTTLWAMPMALELAEQAT